MTLTDPSTTFRTEGSPAPGPLVCVQGFLNTWSDELGIEDFASPEHMELWLRAAGLWGGEAHVEPEDYDRICAFRTSLRDFVRSPGTTTQLTEARSTLLFNIEFDAAGLLQLRALGSNTDQVLGRLLALIYNSMADGTWSRFKCCGLQSCGWAFYDATRSRTKRWCSMQSCGSRHKAREYYKRNR